MSGKFMMKEDSTKIIGTIHETKKWWFKESKGLFHETISLIIGQKIRFVEANRIRKSIYELQSKLSKDTEDKFKPELIAQIITKPEFKVLGQKITIIQEIIKLSDIKEIFTKKIAGVGPWTINALKIYNGVSNIFLANDKWIRNRLSQLNGIAKLTEKEAKNLIKNWDIDKSLLTRFLWRIKESGVSKILSNKQLDKEDFL